MTHSAERKVYVGEKLRPLLPPKAGRKAERRSRAKVSKAIGKIQTCLLPYRKWLR